MFDLILNQQHLLGATKLSTQTLMTVGLGVTVVVSMLTFSNWRAGVKIACVMVLFEGAIRKWVIPGAQELAYFAKDIFLIGAYLRFFFFPDPALRAWRLRIPGGLFTVLCLVVSFSALHPNIGSPLLALYGIKIYMFYLPLAFMIPFLFKSKEDMETNLFWYAMLALPICLLGMLQYARPGDSSLNVMASGEEGTTMGWQGAKIRVTGTFSYITGHTTFIVVFTALHLGLLLNKLSKVRHTLLLINLPLLAGNAFMSGSRSTTMLLPVIGGLFLLATMATKVGNGGNAILKIGAAGAVVGAILVFAFAEARDQWKTRADSSDDTFTYRVIDMPIGSLSLALKFGGTFGYGIGMTHPASERMRSALKIPKPKRGAPVFDVEIGQVLVELGLAGFIAWYTLRLAALGLTYVAFRDSSPGIGKAMALTSLVVQLPHMLLGMVLNHTANFLVFGFFGIGAVALLEPTVRRRFAAQSNTAGLPGTEPAPAVPVPSVVVRGSKRLAARRLS